MTAAATRSYGLATPGDMLHRTGREVLQAVIDGHLPQALISQTLTCRR
jgi:hypothetical protein